MIHLFWTCIWLLLIHLFYFFARFLFGFFFGGIPWYIGTFILLCARVDYREKPGYIACTIAVSIFVVQYLFFYLHEVVFCLYYFLSLWFHVLIWTSANNFASVHYISFETGPIILKWAIYTYFLNLWLVLWHSRRQSSCWIWFII